MKKHITKPRKTLPKKERHPKDIPHASEEIWEKYLNELEAADCSDMRSDAEEAKWKKSDDYLKRKELAEKFLDKIK